MHTTMSIKADIRLLPDYYYNRQHEYRFFET